MPYARWSGLILGIAVFILAPVAHASSRAEATIKIPVVPYNLNRGMIITDESLQHILIHVLGPASLIETLPSLKLTYDLNLAGMNIGHHIIPARKDCVKLPQGLSINAIAPLRIHLRLDKEIEKELPVKIISKGNPAAGYLVAATLATPERILLIGPKQRIDDLHYISTAAIDVTGVSASFKKEVPLVLMENVRTIPASFPIVAQILIAEEISTKTLKDLVVQGEGTSRAFQISPPLITIEVKGPAIALAKLESKDDFNVYINLAGLQPGVFVRRATIELPVEITLIDGEPKIFTVTIK
jgi:hypothetical protein